MEAIAWVLGLGIAAYLLFRFPKPFLITLGILLGVAAAVAGFLWWQSNSAESEKRMVRMFAAVDERCSDPAYPLFIGTENRTTRNVEKVYFTVRAHRPGFSEPVYLDSYLSSDRIIEPTQGWGSCWSLDATKVEGLDIKALTWSAEIISVTFAQR